MVGGGGGVAGCLLDDVSIIEIIINCIFLFTEIYFSVSFFDRNSIPFSMSDRKYSSFFDFLFHFKKRQDNEIVSFLSVKHENIIDIISIMSFKRSFSYIENIGVKFIEVGSFDLNRDKGVFFDCYNIYTNINTHNTCIKSSKE